jgi:hypothetical protein
MCEKLNEHNRNKEQTTGNSQTSLRNKKRNKKTLSSEKQDERVE